MPDYELFTRTLVPSLSQSLLYTSKNSLQPPVKTQEPNPLVLEECGQKSSAVLNIYTFEILSILPLAYEQKQVSKHAIILSKYDC